ncbi:MAG: 4-(cytidine 5'-diphospho)-2-C-methyl-D-erythritol kinase [Phycisphaerales bacterium]|nr:MAG: 4-(cytidine 5'-diphospho)-2-C-methyl-D-erythritol kinase [Phycisphaerales bacterium]
MAKSDRSIQAASARADAYAKINLTLDVIGLRDDGFHEIRSLVIGIDVKDEVRCTRRSEPGFTLDCADSALCGDDNLILRAGTALADHTGTRTGLKIELLKRTPLGAGLGGGSSDAATMLRLCNRLWGLGLDDAGLAEVGSSIGSDVPLFLSLPSAVITGRGEQVELVSLSWSGWVLLVFAGGGVSTADVYREWRTVDSSQVPGGMDAAILRATTADELSKLVSNQLQPAVFRVSPSIARTHQQLQRLGFGPMTVSGAGSTMYRLFDDKNDACHIAAEIEHQGLDVATQVVAAPVGQGPIMMSEED